MTQLLVVVIGLVVGFVGSRAARSIRSSSNLRPGSDRGSASSFDRLRRMEDEPPASAPRPAPPSPAAPRQAAPSPPPAPAPLPEPPRTRPLADPAAGAGDRTQVVAGAEARLVAEADGRSHRLSGQGVTIGRGSDRDIRVEGAQASREHGTFRPRRSGPGWTYTDLGSSNGTRINGRAVTPNRRIELRDGDTVELGGARFTFRAAPPPARRDPRPDPDRTQVLDPGDEPPR